MTKSMIKKSLRAYISKDMESDSFKEKIRQMLKRELKKSSKVEDAADGLA